MTDSILSAPHFHNEAAAYEYVEKRLWPHGPVCPKCGSISDKHYRLKGKSTRVGVWKCRDCRKPFRVTVGTVFEASHIPLRVWLQALHLIASSKKGMSSNQLHRSLKISLKSAWFMSHRIREAMKSDGAPFGLGGGDVEVDETFIGRDKTVKPDGVKKGRGFAHKNKVLSLVDRNTGRARSIVVDNLKASTLLPLLTSNIYPEARILTDEAAQYGMLDKFFRGHEFVKHMHGEYVSTKDSIVHTNTIEGFFSIFKRGMKGVYQHCAHNHLHRYVAEFDFRYNNRAALEIDDQQRAERLLQGVKGKRLTYQTATV